MNYKNLIFEGGGVKGIAHVGSIEVLEEQNILDHIQNVAGTSAGAITATLIALNYSAKEISNIIMGLDFRKFEDGFNPFRIFMSYGIYKGDVFKAWIKDMIVNAGLPQDATFLSMSTNSQFKRLKIFATDLNTESIQEFSSEQTPNTIIAEAVRASMSIPLFFKSWQFSNNYPNDHIYIDGGVLNNYPIRIFKNLDETICFGLSNPEGSNHNNKLSAFSPIKYAKVLFDIMINSQSVKFQKNRAEQKHSVIINDLNLSATDFSLSDEMKRKLIHQGRIATERFLGISILS